MTGLLFRPVEFQPGFLNNIQWNLHKVALRQFQQDVDALKASESSFERFLVLQRDSRLDLRQLSFKASVVRILNQLAIQTR